MVAWSPPEARLTKKSRSFRRDTVRFMRYKRFLSALDSLSGVISSFRARVESMKAKRGMGTCAA